MRTAQWRRGDLVVAAVSCTMLMVSTVVAAQEPEEEEEPVSNLTEFALVETTGNSETFTFSFKNKFIRRWERSSITIDALALRTQTTDRVLTNVDGEVVETSEEEVTGDQYGLAFTYDRKISERTGWFTIGAWQRNRPAGINTRSSLDGGLSYIFFDNDTHTLIGQGGFGYTNEEPVGGDRENFPTARAFASYDRNLSRSSSFDTRLELIENLDNTDDLRVNFLVGVTAKVVEKLALRVSYTVNFDNDPVMQLVPGDDPGEPDRIFVFDKTDTILAASLVIDW